MAKVKQASGSRFKARSLKPDFSEVRQVSAEAVQEVETALKASRESGDDGRSRLGRKRRKEARRELEKRLK